MLHFTSAVHTLFFSTQTFFFTKNRVKNHYQAQRCAVIGFSNFFLAFLGFLDTGPKQQHNKQAIAKKGNAIKTTKCTQANKQQETKKGKENDEKTQEETSRSNTTTAKQPPDNVKMPQ